MTASYRYGKHNIFFLFCCSILFLLTGCGSNGPNTATPMKNTASTITVNAQSIYCPDRTAIKQPSNNLVLKTDQTQYDSGEIQQIKAYVQKAAVGNISQNGIAHPETMPAALEWMYGTTTGGTAQNGCSMTLTLVNSSNQPFLFHNITVREIQTPVKNDAVYHLLDYCSLGALNPTTCTPPTCTQCGAGGGDTPSRIYTCEDTILLKNTATTFVGTTMNTDNQPLCTDTYLNPQDTLVATIHISSQQNFIYNITATASIQLPDGNKDYPILQKTAIAFAKPEQMSCYQLRNNLFYLIPLNAPNSWCL
ncbi:hypothetical protein [Dictyobacter arantiisoli]|uniref:Lipoprotein n=1 Tax=Dictyobacter arantiisoli TaxID=2014874 RepID=A0A5A5TAX4_9CHLR|nr:hypothetical protein [Dictyobacter arantiisoli]GCF08507.1 hypothetical protein KDI_20710 [Dictyobacter arantiisoli]